MVALRAQSPRLILLILVLQTPFPGSFRGAQFPVLSSVSSPGLVPWTWFAGHGSPDLDPRV